MHCSSDLRDRFEELVDQRRWTALAEFAGKLWRCTDIMSSILCSQLDMLAGSSYAQAARSIRRDRR